MAPLVVLVCLAVGIASASPSSAGNRLFSLKRESLAEEHVSLSELLDLSEVQKPGLNVHHIRPLQEGGKMRTHKSERTTSAVKPCENPDDGCRAFLSPGKYVLSSPNYPANYSNDILISWVFTVQTNHSISIACPEFDVEGEMQTGMEYRCWLDKFIINAVQYCGRDSIEEISADSLKLHFYSNTNEARKGFRCDIVVADPAAPVPGTVDGSEDGCSCGLANRASRIIGGVQTEEHEYPWQAGVRVVIRNRVISCGGSVISSAYVLTAAHCFRKTPNSVWVVLGSSHVNAESDDELFKVASYIIHPLYDKTDRMYDYALLRTLQPIPFGPHISPVCLPTPGETYSDAMATASGYGRKSNDGSISDVLLEVDLRVWSPLDCKMFMEPRTYKESVMLCAGGESGKATCKGDSGGPLVTEIDGRYVLIGVRSFGMRDCGTAGHPALYARVTGVLDWIQEQTVNSTYCT